MLFAYIPCYCVLYMQIPDYVLLYMQIPAGGSSRLRLAADFEGLEDI